MESADFFFSSDFEIKKIFFWKNITHGVENGKMCLPELRVVHSRWYPKAVLFK